MDPITIKVLEFLHSLKMRNVGYRDIITARSALSTFITIDTILLEISQWKKPVSQSE